MTNFKFSFKKSCNGTTIKYKKIEVVLQLKMVVGDGTLTEAKSRSKSVVTCSPSTGNDEFGLMFCNPSNRL